jgi:hypothetical protein
MADHQRPTASSTPANFFFVFSLDDNILSLNGRNFETILNRTEKQDPANFQ